jgi:rhodanese-related sulfurtransferase
MNKLSPNTVKQKMASEQEKVCFIDVRSEDEFKSGHVPGATCVPLDQIECGKAELPRDKLVILSCQSGKRSARAHELLKAKGYENLTEMEGGFSAWAAHGLPVNRTRRAIPVIRQVMLVAGLLVLTGSILGLTLNSFFFAVPVFVGAGLIFAGATGWCGLAYILERMPWNHSS